MLEAGPMWDPVDATRPCSRGTTTRRGAARRSQERQFGEFDGALGGWTLDGEPYTTAPGSQFDWFRSRMLGGRTNHWGRISLRFGPDDFRARRLDGLGDDWPITYDDIKPYYDKVDQLIGIFGTNLAELAQRAGRHLPAAAEAALLRAPDQAGVATKLNIPCVPSRLSILTQPLNGRPACHYCGQCGRGCATHSNFSSPSVLIPPAMATGKLKIIANAMAREVTVDDATGLATGVAYIDKSDACATTTSARASSCVAASACESARILLNSKSSRFPQGLGNSSGTVGKYLTDSTGTGVTGFIPKLMDGVPHNEDGIGGMHLYMPWWLDNKKLDFPRGYHIEIGGGRRMPGAGFVGGIHNFTGDRRAVGHAARVRRLRQGAEARLPPALRRDGQLRRPRRDDPEQGQLPARSIRASSTSGASRCCASTSSGATTRCKQVEAHAGDLPRDHRRDGRHADVDDADAKRGLRPRAGRPDHPRARRHPHGQRSDRRRC